MNASRDAHSHPEVSAARLRAFGQFGKRSVAVALALAGIGLVLWIDSWFAQHTDMPDFSRDVNYGLLFLIGFLTSFHCVGMCGPLVIGYTAEKGCADAGAHHRAHLLYGLGKTLSYTAIGGLFGTFGAFVAFTPATQGAVGVAAGAFLMLFGLHMLNVFPALRHFQIKPPACLMRFVGKRFRQCHNPFAVGLLNGLMIICGPLQAMYVMAAGSESGLAGASLLFFFGLGTLPMMMGFGLLTSLLSANLAPKLLKASGVVVVILGTVMLNRGLAISGTGADFNTLAARVSQTLSPAAPETESCAPEQVIRMDVGRGGFVPDRFTLRKGVPVKWVIDGQDLNECNKAIVVPEYGLNIQLRPGEQTIEFVPEATGAVSWSCWMGMIPGTFIVVDDAAEPAPSAVEGALIRIRTAWDEYRLSLKKTLQEWLQD